ncbi:hypothetical protein D3C87_915420 [compost metagenome]
MADLHPLGIAGGSRRIDHVGQAGGRDRNAAFLLRATGRGRHPACLVQHEHLHGGFRQCRHIAAGNDHGTDACIVQHVPHPSGGIRGIDRHVGRARLEHTQHRHDGQGRPPDEYAYPVAWAHPCRGQIAGQSPRPRIELAVGEPALPTTHGERPRLPAGLRLDQAIQRGRAITRRHRHVRSVESSRHQHLFPGLRIQQRKRGPRQIRHRGLTKPMCKLPMPRGKRGAIKDAIALPDQHDAFGAGMQFAAQPRGGALRAQRCQTPAGWQRRDGHELELDPRVLTTFARQPLRLCGRIEAFMPAVGGLRLGQHRARKRPRIERRIQRQRQRQTHGEVAEGARELILPLSPPPLQRHRLGTVQARHECRPPGQAQLLKGYTLLFRRLSQRGRLRRRQGCAQRRGLPWRLLERQARRVLRLRRPALPVALPLPARLALQQFFLPGRIVCILQGILGNPVGLVRGRARQRDACHGKILNGAQVQAAARGGQCKPDSRRTVVPIGRGHYRARQDIDLRLRRNQDRLVVRVAIQPLPCRRQRGP